MTALSEGSARAGTLQAAIAFIRGERASSAGIAAASAGLCVVAALGSLCGLPAGLLAVVLSLLLLLLCNLIWRRLGLDGPTVFILLAALLLYLGYLSYTDAAERNLDAPAQLEGIIQLARRHKIPQADLDAIGNRAPLYFILGAAVHWLCRVTTLADPLLGLQLLSLLLFLVFLSCAALTIKGLAPSRGAAQLATGLLAFWPYSVITSVRIHNDLLIYALAGAAAYFLLRWLQRPRFFELLLSCVFAALTMMTQAAGYLPVALVVAVVCRQLYRRSDRLVLLRHAAPALLGLALLTFAGHFALRAPDHRTPGVVAAGVAIPNPLTHNENRVSDYLYFGLEEYLSRPYVAQPPERPKTQVESYYFPDLLKSSLFGTRSIAAVAAQMPDDDLAELEDPDEPAAPPAVAEPDFTPNDAIAEILSFLLLAMVIFTLAVALRLGRRDGDERRFFALAWLGLAICVSLGARIRAEEIRPTDFAFIYPALTAACLLFARAVDACRRRGLVLQPIGWALAVGLIALSTIYFLPSYHALVTTGP